MEFIGDHICKVWSTQSNYDKEECRKVKSNTVRSVDKYERFKLESGDITHIIIQCVDDHTKRFIRLISDIAFVDMYELNGAEDLVIISWG